MKKFFAIVVVFVVLIGCYSFPNTFSLKNYFNGSYSCYTEQFVDNNSIDLGFCYLNNSYNKNALGESVVVNNLQPSEAINKLKANVIKCETLDNGATIIYAFSSKISSSVNLDGFTVNLQIACYDDHCVIGWPLILGSY